MVSIFMRVSLFVVVGEKWSLAGLGRNVDGAGTGNGRKKAAGLRAAAFSIEAWSVRLQAAVAQAHAVADLPAAAAFLIDGAQAAVLEAHGDLRQLVGAHLFFDLVAGDRAADGADDGGGSVALAAADLVSKQAAQYAAGNGAKARTFGRLADFAHRFDGAAVAAERRRAGRAGRDDVDPGIVGRIGGGRLLVGVAQIAGRRRVVARRLLRLGRPGRRGRGEALGLVVVAAGGGTAVGAASSGGGGGMVAVNGVSGADLPGSRPVKLAMAARLAMVTAAAATMIIGWVL